MMDVRPAANQGSAGVGSDPHLALARLLPLLLPVVATGAAALTASLIALAADPPSRTALVGLVALFAAAVLAEANPVPIERLPVGTDLARRGLLRRDGRAVRAGGGALCLRSGCA